MRNPSRLMKKWGVPRFHRGRESEGFFLARKKVRGMVDRFFSTLLDDVGGGLDPRRGLAGSPGAQSILLAGRRVGRQGIALHR